MQPARSTYEFYYYYMSLRVLIVNIRIHRTPGAPVDILSNAPVSPKPVKVMEMALDNDGAVSDLEYIHSYVPRLSPERRVLSNQKVKVASQLRARFFPASF